MTELVHVTARPAVRTAVQPAKRVASGVVTHPGEIEGIRQRVAYWSMPLRWRLWRRRPAEYGAWGRWAPPRDPIVINAAVPLEIGGAT